MKKNNKTLLLIISSIFSLSAITLFALNETKNNQSNASEIDYLLTFAHSKNPIIDSDNKKIPIKTTNGNKINFESENVFNDENVWHTLEKRNEKPGYFYNKDKINGISSISFVLDFSETETISPFLTLCWGWSQGSTTERSMSFNVKQDKYSVIFDDEKPCYFGFYHLGAVNKIIIKSIEISYSCINAR